ncbi:MAG: hypothetical protein WBQ08_16530 [Candidatus Sulfotelmatobacter sp.]
MFEQSLLRRICALSKVMVREKLVAFFRGEIDAEEQWGFPRLNRIPESFLQDRLNHYRGLSDSE